LATWDQILEYLERVASASPRVRLDVVGETTSGNPFVVVLVSSSENLRRLPEYRDIARRLASGTPTAAEALDLAARGKTFVFLNHNIHSTEIASSQTSLELIYRLAVDEGPVVREILDNTVLIHVPSGNPDGQILTVDWYEDNLGTPFERASMPWLYHPYVGHDNNRDFFMGNMVETRIMMRLLYHDWHPQIYLDQHQMGPYGARMFVPPFPDPPNERIHPLIWQQIKFLGGGMATDLQVAGKQGVLTNAMYRIYHQGGALSVWWHNIVGLLTETASASMATPLTIERDQLRPTRPDRGLPEYRQTKSFPDPWWGGPWHLRDIVDYQMIAAMSVLKQAARYRSEFLANHWRMAHDAIAQADSEGPFAYVVPIDQRDPVTAAEMLERLALQGIEVHQAEADLPAGGTVYAKGSWVLLAAQSHRAALVDLFETQSYPELRLYPGGPPIRPYDVTGYTLPLQMGVTAVPVHEPFDTVSLSLLARVAAPEPPPVPQASRGLVLNHEINATVVAVNRLLAEGIPIRRLLKATSLDGRRVSPGAFLVVDSSSSARGAVERVSRELSVPVGAAAADLVAADLGPALRPPRVGLYRSWVPSIDEGWTRWILERFEFSYESVRNDDIRNGGSLDRFDVLVIPAELELDDLINGHPQDSVPARYTGGIGMEGVDRLRAFVETGGTLVTLDSGGQVVLEHFDVPVSDAVADVPTSDFFGPGVILRVNVDPEHPVAYGLPTEVAAKFSHSPAYAVDRLQNGPHSVRELAHYPSDGELLLSGLVVGEEHLRGRVAALEVAYGRGRIVMLGFRVQHRGQTHGTYKLLFNALYYGAQRVAGF
jgi:hypothetical protein